MTRISPEGRNNGTSLVICFFKIIIITIHEKVYR
jgi:hypothetical protein